MKKEKKERMKDMENSDLFALFTDYTKRAIKKDIESMYGDTAYILDSEEPMVFGIQSE